MNDMYVYGVLTRSVQSGAMMCYWVFVASIVTASGFEIGRRAAWTQNTVTVPAFSEGRDFILDTIQDGSRVGDFLSTRSVVFSETPVSHVTFYIAASAGDALSDVAYPCAMLCFLNNEIGALGINPFTTGWDAATHYQVETVDCHSTGSSVTVTAHWCTCLMTGFVPSRVMPVSYVAEDTCVATSSLGLRDNDCNPEGTLFSTSPWGGAPALARHGYSALWDRDTLMALWRAGPDASLSDFGPAVGVYLPSPDTIVIPGACYCRAGWTGHACEYDFTACDALQVSGCARSDPIVIRYVPLSAGGSVGYASTQHSAYSWASCSGENLAAPRCPVGACTNGGSGRFCQFPECVAGEEDVPRCGEGVCTRWASQPCACSNGTARDPALNCLGCIPPFSLGEDGTCSSTHIPCFDVAQLRDGDVSIVACNGHGRCQDKTGQCLCDVGFGDTHCGVALDGGLQTPSRRDKTGSTRRLQTLQAPPPAVCEERVVPVFFDSFRALDAGDACLEVGGRVASTEEIAAAWPHVSHGGGVAHFSTRSLAPSLDNAANAWSDTRSVFVETGSSFLSRPGVTEGWSSILYTETIPAMCAVMPCRSTATVLDTTYRTLVPVEVPGSGAGFTAFGAVMEARLRPRAVQACSSGCPVGSGPGSLAVVADVDVDVMRELGVKTLAQSRSWRALVLGSSYTEAVSIPGANTEFANMEWFSGTLTRTEAMNWDRFQYSDVFGPHFQAFPSRTEAFVETFTISFLRDFLFLPGGSPLAVLNGRVDFDTVRIAGVEASEPSYYGGSVSLQPLDLDFGTQFKPPSTTLYQNDRYWAVCDCGSAPLPDLIAHTRTHPNDGPHVVPVVSTPQ